MKRMKKECVICGCENPFYGWSGYIYFEDSSKMMAGWCKKHDIEFTDYANPIFENENALELFKQLHQKDYNKYVKGKGVLYLYKLQQKNEKKKKHEKKIKEAQLDDSPAVIELRSDFKRVYIHFFGEDGFNEALSDGALPEWLGFTDADKVQDKILKRCKNNGLCLS